jgi:hypothetical protein
MAEFRSRIVVRRALAVTAIGLGCLTVPSAAPAQPRPPRAIQITFPGTHGYGIEVSGNVEGTQSTVTVSTGKPFSSAKYSVRGTITPDRVHASFGRLGTVSLHLTHYRVELVRLSKSCRLPGSPAVSEVRIGTFLGRVRFHGENDYTSGSAARVEGAVGEPTAIFVATGPDRHAKLICLGGPGNAKDSGPPALQATSADGAITFLALSGTASRPDARKSAGTGRVSLYSGPTTFVAAESEMRGPMQISRTVISSAPAADFSFDPGFNAAALTPPAPFRGSGTFLRAADGSTSWSGSLAVSFPGEPNVALVGPQFTASLGTEFQTSGESCSELPGNQSCSSTSPDAAAAEHGRLPNPRFRLLEGG